MPVRQRPELSREGIVAAALALIDANGLAALNMRDLGIALGASTMGVYRHFTSKTALLDAVVDNVIEGFVPAPAKGRWQAQARSLSLTVRGAMLAHPHLADLIGREFRRSPISLRVNTEIIERLRTTGVPPALLPDVYWTISSYTTGYALLEAQSLTRRKAGRGKLSRADRVKKVTALLREVDDIPAQAVRTVADVLSRPLDDAQFIFGLDCIIAGIEQRIAAHKDA